MYDYFGFVSITYNSVIHDDNTVCDVCDMLIAHAGFIHNYAASIRRIAHLVCKLRKFLNVRIRFFPLHVLTACALYFFFSYIIYVALGQ